MKLYMISPPPGVVEAGQDAIRTYLDAVVPVIADAMLPTGREGLVGVWAFNEGDLSDEPFDAEFAGKRIKAIIDREELCTVIRRTADPWDSCYMWVRCQTTCRSVTFGYDGQAFLCLRHEDPVPPRSSLIWVEERSEMLSETDYLDG